MIRISKLTDYGIIIVSFLSKDNANFYQSDAVATQTSIAKPTVSKLLKILTRGDILESKRGAFGGYRIKKEASAISIADIIYLLDGPIEITSCTSTTATCPIESVCRLKAPWKKINSIIVNTLQETSIADFSVM